MTHHTRKPLQAALFSLLLACAAAHTAMAAPSAPPAAKSAADKPASSAAQRAHKVFRDEMAHCASGLSVQSRPVCEQEARAAHAQNLRGALADGVATSPVYSLNAQRRCEPLPPAERSVCMMRVNGKAAPDEVLVVPGSEAPLQATTPPRP